MAHPDLDNLLNELIPFAQSMLAKDGAFYPFGATVSCTGEIIYNAAHNGAEQPQPEELISLMSRAFQQAATSGQIRAAAICSDVRAIPPGQKQKSDSICVSAEHISGEAADAFVPYKKGWFGRISYGELFAGKRSPQFFIARQK